MIPTPLPGARAVYAVPDLQQFAQAAGLPPNGPGEQALLCYQCVIEGLLDVPATIVMYHGTSVCAQHLASMVD